VAQTFSKQALYDWYSRMLVYFMTPMCQCSFAFKNNTHPVIKRLSHLSDTE